MGRSMKKAEKKDEIKGIAGTIVFHALVILALLFLALRTPLPLPSEGGVEVNLGNSEDGMGMIQPEELASAAPVSPPPSTTSETEEYVTSDEEEAPAIEPKKEPKPKPVERTEPKPVVKKEPVPEPAPKVNPKALFPGKSTTGKTGAGGNEGITGKPGDQGNPFGTPDATGYDGDGGSGGGKGGGVGSGISYDLSGRTSKSIPRPSNVFKDEGKVVVKIWVNREGSVVRVESGMKGSTTTSSQLKELAAQAARKAKFSANPDAPEVQTGTITYTFTLN